ncbi:MAG: hypothetical protein ACJAY8_000177 [Sphingobacteriales bacterium]|jgi:hypothetical protein
METFEILKYGALGLCAILLSYVTRLTYMEQKRPGEARKSILRNINYLLLSSILLTIVFAYSEFVSRIDTDSIIQTRINDVWLKKYSKHLNDTTITLKSERIFENSQDIVDVNSICAKYISNLDSCENKILSFDSEFYANILLLRREIEKVGGDFINVDHGVENKKQVYSILRKILTKLDVVSKENVTDEEIRKLWKSTKRTFSSQEPKNIITWDLAQLVRIYINKFYPRIEK